MSGEHDRPPAVLHAVTPYGRTGPSSRVRVLEWLDRIPFTAEAHCYLGLSSSTPSALARRPAQVLKAEVALRDLARSRPDRLILHREASPLSRGSVERRLLRSAAHAVYDLDDALMWDVGTGGLWRKLAPKAPKAHGAVVAADRVVAGSPILADWASDLARDVVLIPSCVEPGRYEPPPDWTLHDPPRIGWIGSPSEEKQLVHIAPVLVELHRRTGARILLVGQPTPRLGPLERFIDRIPWSEVDQGVHLASMDIGIMPLVDEPMERGKCGYKLLQYAAAHLPAVASPVGANIPIARDLGYPTARTSDEWLTVLEALIETSSSRREASGTAGRRAVETGYSFDAWQPTWEAAVGLPARPRPLS